MSYVVKLGYLYWCEDGWRYSQKLAIKFDTSSEADEERTLVQGKARVVKLHQRAARYSAALERIREHVKACNCATLAACDRAIDDIAAEALEDDG